MERPASAIDRTWWAATKVKSTLIKHVCLAEERSVEKLSAGVAVELSILPTRYPPKVNSDFRGETERLEVLRSSGALHLL